MEKYKFIKYKDRYEPELGTTVVRVASQLDDQNSKQYRVFESEEIYFFTDDQVELIKDETVTSFSDLSDNELITLWHCTNVTRAALVDLVKAHTSNDNTLERLNNSKNLIWCKLEQECINRGINAQQFKKTSSIRLM